VTIQDLGSLGELIAAIATVATLIYLAIQIQTSNRLARAEASRTPNSDLNSINSAFAVHLEWRVAMRKVLTGSIRTDLEPDDRLLLDMYLISLTNLQEQLAREIRAGILRPEEMDFGRAGLFRSTYYKTSWSLYRDYLTEVFVGEFEKRYELDPTIEAEW
jgi:hypothetical protein